MNTAQLVLGSAATTTRAQSVLPWVIGGVVLIAALFVISKLQPMAQSSSSNDLGFNSSGGIGIDSSGLMGIAAVFGAIVLIGLVMWFVFKKVK